MGKCNYALALAVSETGAADCPKAKMSRMTNYPASEAVSIFLLFLLYFKVRGCRSSDSCEFMKRLNMFIKDVLSSSCKHLLTFNGVRLTFQEDCRQVSMQVLEVLMQ